MPAASGPVSCRVKVVDASQKYTLRCALRFSGLQIGFVKELFAAVAGVTVRCATAQSANQNMKITKYAQSTFSITNVKGKTLLIDPGKYNFTGTFTPAAFGQVHILVITHKHEDHFDRAAVKELTDLFQPVVLTNSEIADWLSQEGLSCRAGKVGDVVEVEGFKIELIKTDHVVRDESVLNFGLLIEADGCRVYHTSDTRLMEREVLPADRLSGVDALCVPIGNRGVVMGFDDALYFCDQFSPAMIIPMHYDSPKDKDRVRPGEFVERHRVLSRSLKQAARANVKVLGFGESIQLP